MARQPKTKKERVSDNRLFTLDVLITDGPMTDEFAKKNPIISRTIQILGSQTLEHLHKAIFKAFDREDPHMYEFQIGGKSPRDDKAKRYVMPVAVKEPYTRNAPAGTVNRTTIGSLGLKVNDRFSYWFDFGDDWWHQIKVVAIGASAPKEKYPKVANRVGESPPQYIDWEEE